MERSICGSSLVGTRTTDKRSKDYRHICTMDQLEKSLECHFSKESIILHQEPSMTEVGIVSRVEKVGFWKIDLGVVSASGLLDNL